MLRQQNLGFYFPDLDLLPNSQQVRFGSSALWPAPNR
jgi:hypothetical protein